MSVRVLTGHAPDVLAGLGEGSVHACVTSPPYLWLRSYNTAPQEWPSEQYPTCMADGLPDHDWGEEGSVSLRGADPGAKATAGNTVARVCPPVQSRGRVCRNCLAWKGELGQEPTIDLYVAHLCAVFRAVRRVLRDDGTLWVNLGDSYTGGGGGNYGSGKSVKGREGAHLTNLKNRPGFSARQGLQDGDRCLVPYRFALAMQADGWLLRSAIQLVKRAPMPEPVNGWRWVRQGDGAEVLRRNQWRPVQATEVLLQFAKGKGYYCDGIAVREPAQPETAARYAAGYKTSTYGRYQQRNPNDGRNGLPQHEAAPPGGADSRNARDWMPWRHENSGLAHYAAYPTFIPEFAIEAGTSERGVCPRCQAPWARVVEERSLSRDQLSPDHKDYRPARYPEKADSGGPDRGQRLTEVVTVGWRQTCPCPPHSPQPAVVLDCFGGSGTTGLVADRLGRDAILIDLNPEYTGMAAGRIRADAPLFADVEQEAAG